MRTRRYGKASVRTNHLHKDSPCRSQSQNSLQFGNGVQHRLDERIRIRSWPGAVVAIGAKFIILDDMTDFWDKAACLFTVYRDNCFGDSAKPTGIRGKSVASDRLTPGGVVIAAVSRRAL